MTPYHLPLKFFRAARGQESNPWQTSSEYPSFAKTSVAGLAPLRSTQPDLHPSTKAGIADADGALHESFRGEDR